MIQDTWEVRGFRRFQLIVRPPPQPTSIAVAPSGIFRAPRVALVPVRGLMGNLYGTTSGDGASGMGVVYKVDKNGNETVLYSFTGRADGGTPWGGVMRDAAGNSPASPPMSGS